jgi:hypothetical protein
VSDVRGCGAAHAQERVTHVAVRARGAKDIIVRRGFHQFLRDAEIGQEVRRIVNAEKVMARDISLIEIFHPRNFKGIAVLFEKALVPEKNDKKIRRFRALNPELVMQFMWRDFVNHGLPTTEKDPHLGGHAH